MLNKFYVNLKFEEKISREYLLNPWEMYKKSSDITSFLYKSESIFKIINLYLNGENLKNIFIFNEVVFQKKLFKINKKIIKQDYYDALIDLFTIGNIYTLEPNFYLFKLQYLIKEMIKINKEILKKFDYQLLNKKFLKKIIEDYENKKQIEKIIEEISISINQKLKSSNNYIKKYFYKEFKFDNIYKEIDRLSRLEKAVNENNEEGKLYLQKYNIHIMHVFRKNAKPLFGYFISGLEFDFIEKYMLIFNKDRINEFLNLKELSHKSPLFVCVGVGLSIYTLSLLGLNKMIENEKANFENINEINQIENSLYEKHTALKNLQLELEHKNKIISKDFNVIRI